MTISRTAARISKAFANFVGAAALGFVIYAMAIGRFWWQHTDGNFGAWFLCLLGGIVAVWIAALFGSAGNGGKKVSTALKWATSMAATAIGLALLSLLYVAFYWYGLALICGIVIVILGYCVADTVVREDTPSKEDEPAVVAAPDTEAASQEGEKVQQD
ncbi:MAG TPA: hypothetical protein VLF91_06615 [Candidatus Saccharimonadales bacterium]|nr:hypothetical protein [Candidatus Saccharimonadales bacterium]